MTWFDSFYYFVFGFAFCQFLNIIFTYYRTSNGDHDSNSNNSTTAANTNTKGGLFSNKAYKFYLNLFISDRKTLLENMARNKISRKRPLMRALGKRVLCYALEDKVRRLISEITFTVFVFI